MQPASAPVPGPEQLLEHDAFVRSLARHLIGDAAGAEDLAQETWVAALEHPQRHPGPLRAWLAAVLRNLAWKRRRTEERRAVRERAVTRPEPVPTGAEVLAREEQRRRLVEKVLALPEPSRSTMLLRYFRQLPPAAIANQLGEPVETVRTRIKRALERLRGDLDRENGGDRGAWLAALLPFTKEAPVAVPTTALAGVSSGVVMMAMALSVKAKVAAAVVVAAAIAWVLIGDRDAMNSGTRATATSRSSVDESAAASASSAAAPRSPVTTATEIAADRAVASPLPGSDLRLAALHVTAIWGADQGRAADVGVFVCTAQTEGMRFRRCVVTDARGECRIDDLEPGPVSVLSDRGDGASDLAQPMLIPGRTTDVTLVIRAGPDIDGEVVDTAGDPVADADIWVGDDFIDSGSGRIVTCSDAEGRFRIRSVSGTRLIGARAAGHSPSLLSVTSGPPGSTLHLRLELRGPGGTVTGTVTDPDGHPIARASVQIGDETRRVASPDHAYPYQLLLRTETSEEGRFEFAGVMPERLPLQVRARGWSPWTGEVSVDAGMPVERTIVLARGVMLDGSVRDERGTPLADVEIASATSAPKPRFAEISTRSRVDGGFELGPIPPGHFDAHAERTGLAAAKAAFSGEPGERLRWDIVLGAGLTLAGRIVDEEDRPVADCQVGARGPSKDAASGCFAASAVSDEQGFFALTGCPDVALDLQVEPPGAGSPTTKHGVRAGRDEIVVQVALGTPQTAWIEGVVVDHDGRPCTNARIGVWVPGRTSTSVEPVDPATGHFKSGPYPQGSARLVASAPGHVDVTIRVADLAANETRELGSIRLAQGGAFRVAVQRANGEAIVGIDATCFGRESGREMRLVADAGEVRSGDVAPGEYLLAFHASGFATALTSVVVQPDETAKLVVTLEPAPASVHSIHLEAPLPPPLKQRVLEDWSGLCMRIEDEGGRTVDFRRSNLDEQGTFRWTLALPTGSYTLTMSAAEGLLASANFEVTSALRDSATIRLDLR
jgi:RNA polymerase sigma-70 factor (ECF subfamily)